MIVQFAVYRTSAKFQAPFFSILNSKDRSLHEDSLNILPTNVPYYINLESFSQPPFIAIL